MGDAIEREDFRWVAGLLRGYAMQDDKSDKRLLFRALCSDNLNTILVALDIAGKSNAAAQEPSRDQTG